MSEILHMPDHAGGTSHRPTPGAPPRVHRASGWRVAAMVASHLFDDLYQGAVPAMLPFFVAERHYGYVAAAGITLAATLLSSVVQPLFGLLTDRHPMPWLVPAGLSVAGLGIALSGLVDSYLWTWCAIALSGVGVASYHPESTRLARAASDGSHVGMSWYSLGGNVGFALGPIVVAPVVSAFGLPATPLLIIPAVVAGVALALLLRPLASKAQVFAAGALAGLEDDWRQFSLLAVIVTGRSIVGFALNTFLALWVIEHLHAHGQFEGQVALVLYFGCGAVGTLAGGFLARRWERVRILRLSYLLSVPALAGIGLAPGAFVFFFIAASGIVLFLPFSLQVTLGQDYLPTRIGTASGVTLGLSISIGGLAAPAIGALAEAIGLEGAILVLIVVPAACWLLSLWIREPRQVTG
ncbi:MAG TPA: MFS transporter [Microbacteriaceae bacterium]|nr:MFS transporter [Microbacteriaceae bacterium]